MAKKKNELEENLNLNDFLLGGRVGNKEGYQNITDINNSKNRVVPTVNNQVEEQRNKFDIRDIVRNLDWKELGKKAVLTTNPLLATIDTGKKVVNYVQNTPLVKNAEGNLIQNIGGTIADTGLDISKGFLNYVENFTDFVEYSLADVSESFGAKDYASNLRRKADLESTKALFGENENNTENIFTRNIDEQGNMEPSFHEKIDKYSYFDKGIDDVAEGVGQLLATMGTTELLNIAKITPTIESTLIKNGVNTAKASQISKSIATSLTSYSSSYGGTYSQLRKAGVDDKEARTQARISGLVEAVSEQLHDGIPGTKTMGWADKITDKIAKNRWAKTVLNSLGEVDEEIFGNILTNVINDTRMIFDKDNEYLNNNYSGNFIQDIKNGTFSEESMDEYLTVFLSSLITNAGSNVGQNINKEQMIKDYAKENNIKYETAKKRLGLEINADNEITSNKDRLYNDTVSLIETTNGEPLTDYNKKQIEVFIDNIKDYKINKVTSEDVAMLFDDYKSSQADAFQDEALELFPSLDENNKKLYYDLINDVSKLIYNTGINVKFDPELNNLSQWDNGTLIINPTKTDVPIKTMMLKELGTYLLDNSSKQNILSYTKKTGLYNALKRDLINSGEYNENNVDSEIISRALNDIFSSQAKLESFANSSKSAYNEIKSLITNLDANINLRNTKDAEFLNQLTAMMDNINAKKQVNIAPKTTTTNKKAGEKTLENIKKSGLVRKNGGGKTLTDILTNISNEKGIEFDITNNEKIKNDKNIDGVINGYVEDNKIVINIDSKKALNKVFGHEITHLLEGSKDYDNLKKMLVDYAKSQKDYDNRIKQLNKLYENVDNAEIENELVSDLAGDYLFTDRSFVDSIAKKDKTLFEKIYDAIKRFIKELTGTDSERQLLHIEDMYKEIYDNTVLSNKGIKYSLSLKESGETTDNFGRDLTKAQQRRFKNSKITDKNGHLQTVYHTTTRAMLQFNEFDPRKFSGNYRFGDDIVNFYSDSKEMSGSYANQRYNMADTKKLKNVKEAKKWLEDNRFSGLIPYDYEILEVKGEDGKEDFINVYLTNYEDGSDISSFQYTSEEEMLKKIKNDVLSVNKAGENAIQYEGYLNITNPYVIDAEGRYWNKVKRKIEDRMVKFIEYAEEHPKFKDKIINMQKTSQRLYEQWRNSTDSKIYQSIRNITDDINYFDNFGTIRAIQYALYNHVGYKQGVKIAQKKYTGVGEKKYADENSLVKDLMSDYDIKRYKNVLERYGEDFEKLTIKRLMNFLKNGMAYNSTYAYSSKYWDDKINQIYTEEEKDMLNELDITNSTLYELARHGLSKEYIEEIYSREMSTNDVVFEILKENKENDAGYDGVVFENVVDYGGYAQNDKVPHTVIVSFASNQFKSVDNKNPTDDPDIRYSLGEENEVSRGFEIKGEDIKKPVKKAKLEDNIVQDKDEYRSTEKLPETTKKGTYIEPSTPIKQNTKKGQRFVKQITNQNVLTKELSKNYTSFVDKLHPIQELADVSGNKQLYAKFNNRGMSNGKGQYQIGTAQTDNDGRIIGKSVNDIFKPVESSGLSSEFDDYLAHRLNIERYDKVPVWDEDVTPEISQEIVDEYEEKYPQFKKWANDVYTFNDNQLQKMIDAGLSKENARDWLYENYVTIARDISPRTNPLLVNAKGVKINSPIRKAKGSNLEIRPMKEAMARQTLLTERSIADNIAGQELLNVLGGTVGESKSLLTQDMEGNNNALIKNPDGTYDYTVYKNGIPVTMQVTKEVADAIRPSKAKEWEDLLPFKAVRGLSGLQRGLLTDKNPLFIFTNFFKDIGDAPLNSKFSAGELYANYPKAVSKMLKNAPEWQQYVANGGLANTYFETKSGEFTKSSNKFVSAIQTMNQLVEQAPRFTEYLNTLAHGGTIQEALYNSAEITTNFARGGEITKILNRNGFNFLNASVQGFDKQIRNFTRQPGAKGYIQLLTKVALLGVLPALLNNALLGDDDDYEELPDYVKDNYYLFKTSDNNFIRIPKGRVMSIFGTVARHTVEVGKGKETLKDLAKNTGEQIMNNVAPNNPLENNILSPLISVANNKSWSGSKIVSTTLQNYPDAYQYDEKTTTIAKWLGKTFNYSPKKIDYLLDQYTGGIGDVIMPMTTPYAETKSDNIIENAIISPFKSKFTVDSTISNKYVNEYYDTKNELQKEMKTYSSIEESPEAFEKALQYKYLDSVGNEISKLYNDKRALQNSDLSNEQKYEQARAIQRQIDDLAKFAMQDYNTGYYTDDYAIVGNKEFTTKVTNGKMNWTEIDEKTKKKQLEYAEKYDMSPEEYYSMEGLTGSTIAGSNIYDFKEMNKKLTNIRDNTTNDKEETFKYINSLDISLPQKAMYLRKFYKSYNDYNNEIFNYVNSLNIINEQKKAILIYLGFDYDKKTGTFYWK